MSSFGRHKPLQLSTESKTVASRIVDLAKAMHREMSGDYSADVSKMVDAELRFAIPGKPQPKQRARQGRGGRHYTPPATRAFESLVRMVGLQAVQRWKVANGLPWDMTGAFAIGVTAYMPDLRTRDLSNVEKSIEDGLNRVVWNDDRQIKRRLEGGLELDRENPRTEVVVRRIGFRKGEEASDG